MQKPRLSLYRHALQLKAGSEPPLATGVVSYHRGRASVPVCIDIVERLWDHYDVGLQIDDDALEALQAQRIEMQARQETMFCSDKILPRYDENLWPHQRQAAYWLHEVKRGILADEQGMGKTISALTAIGAARSVLVVCQNIKKADWSNEGQRWRADDLYYTLDGDLISRGELLIEWISTGGVMICNYDQLADQANQIAFAYAEAVILDEAHKVRNRKSLWRKAAVKLTKGKSVYILTANPTVNKPEEIWTLLNLCDPDRFRSYWSFVYRFFDTSTNGFGIQIGDVRPHEQERLQTLIAPYLLQRTCEQVGGLGIPEVRRWVVYHEMIGEQQRLYHSLETTDRASMAPDGVIDDEMVETWLPIQKITRLRQLAIDPGILFSAYSGPSKIDTLVKVIRQQPGRQTLVFSMFESAANQARHKLLQNNVAADVLSGTMTDRHRTDVLDGFASGRIKVICATHGTGGEGLNLPEASRVIFLELAWHPAGNRQAQGRAVRPGQQADEVEVIVIHTKDSVEDYIWSILKSKQRVTIDKLIQRGAV